MPADDRIHLTPRARSTILWVAAAVVLFFVWQLRGLLEPLVWAAITAYLLNPVVVWLARRTQVSRRLWGGALFVLLVGIVVLGIWWVAPTMSAQAQDFAGELPRHFREAGRLLGVSEVQVFGTTLDFAASDEDIRRQVDALLTQAGEAAVPAALPYVLDTLFKLLLYLVSAFFLLVDAGQIRGRVLRFAPPGARRELAPWLERISSMLGAYLRAQAFLFALMTVAVYITLEALGVRFAPLLAVFSGVVLLVPYIGPYIAGGASVLVALTQGTAPYGWSPVVLAAVVAIAYTILRQLEGNFVMPFLIGRLVDLHPLTVIFVVLAGAALAGVLGLLIAVPIATTVKIVAEYLYGKLREQPPPAVAIIEPGDGWREIAASIREAAAVSRAAGASPPRILISAPSPPPVLCDRAQFQRLIALIGEAESDTILVTPDPALRDLARAAGITMHNE